MTLRESVDRILGRTGGEDPDVALFCPLQDEDTEATRIATEGTEPDTWVQDDRVAVYDCPVCGSRHRFLWGPPAPLYLGDESADDDTVPGATGNEAYKGGDA